MSGYPIIVNGPSCGRPRGEQACSTNLVLTFMDNMVFVPLKYCDPLTVINDTSQLFAAQNIKTRIIVGSIRNMLDINKALLAGADIVTVPFQFLKKMATNLKTEQTIREFNDVWKDMKEKGLIRLKVRERAPILTLVNK